MRRLYPQELLKLSQAQPYPPDSKDFPIQRPSVTIVILSWNRLHLTRRCLESILAHTILPYELLILDNGSQHEIVAYLNSLEQAHQHVRVLYLPENIGMSRGRNRAFGAVTTEYICSLDNDIICHPNWLDEMLACAVRRNADFVTPLPLNPLGAAWAFAPDMIRTLPDPVAAGGEVLEIARWFHDIPPAALQRMIGTADMTTNFMPGGLGLYRTATFHACGGFDDFYQGGFEDMDFSLSLKERGHTIWATPRAMVSHDDAWKPQTEADKAYAHTRFSLERLRRDAVHFQDRWGVNVLPEKFATSIAQRLQSKLGHHE